MFHNKNRESHIRKSDTFVFQLIKRKIFKNENADFVSAMFAHYSILVFPQNESPFIISI